MASCGASDPSAQSRREISYTNGCGCWRHRTPLTSRNVCTARGRKWSSLPDRSGDRHGSFCLASWADRPGNPLGGRCTLKAKQLRQLRLVDLGNSQIEQDREASASSNGAAKLSAGRQRLCARLAISVIYSEREIEFLPNRNQGVSQLLDQPHVVRRGGGNPQSLGPSGDRRIMNRRDVDS